MNKEEIKPARKLSYRVTLAIGGIVSVSLLLAYLGLMPEMNLVNQVSKQRARALLELEDEWF